MKIIVLVQFNIFYKSGPSNNRWRAIVEGLAQKKDVEVLIIIIGGYFDKEEKSQYGVSGEINSQISYRYLNNQLSDTLRIRRINRYLLSGFYKWITIFNFLRTFKELKGDYLFLMPSLEVYKFFINKFVINSFKNFKKLIEFNEYFEYQENQNINFLLKLRNSSTKNIFLKKVLPQLDICLVMTKKLESYLINLFEPYNSKISYYHLPMSVDFNRFEKKASKSTNFISPYISYTGSSSFNKDGVDILIKAFELIASDHPQLRLYIAAFMEFDGVKMKQLISQSKFADRIIYLGELDRQLIPELLLNAESLLLPRPNSLQAEYGFPTKLGEYLATGVPVCATNVGEIPYYLTDNISVFFAEPGSVESFASSINRVLVDKNNAQKVGENGRQIANKNFNKDVQGEALQLFLKNKIIN
jgi:glycosyltransferase involved in cell wall biosynthesis